MGRPKGSKNLHYKPVEERIYRDGHNERRTLRRAGLLAPFVAETSVEEALIVAGLRTK